jgi:hypothetical protein
MCEVLEVWCVLSERALSRTTESKAGRGNPLVARQKSVNNMTLNEAKSESAGQGPMRAVGLPYRTVLNRGATPRQKLSFGAPFRGLGSRSKNGAGESEGAQPC